jgi:hypothetical protein
MALVQQDKVGDFTIVPQATAPPISTSDWPLLLKDYDKRVYPFSPYLLHAVIAFFLNCY